MKKLLKITIFAITIIFALFVSVNAQSNEKFTYRDLPNQQKVERDELKKIQNETLDKILIRQKEELEKISRTDSRYDWNNLQSSHQNEREKIVQLQKEEREKLMQIQTEERKNFKPL